MHLRCRIPPVVASPLEGSNTHECTGDKSITRAERAALAQCDERHRAIEALVRTSVRARPGLWEYRAAELFRAAGRRPCPP